MLKFCFLKFQVIWLNIHSIIAFFHLAQLLYNILFGNRRIFHQRYLYKFLTKFDEIFLFEFYGSIEFK